jgi:O-methyltransferase involved in polyketide biosynthesis
MPTKLPVELGTLQETLLVPLWARAREAAEAHPVLRDPYAADILARLDYDFTPLDGARASQLGCCVRGALVDHWVRQFLRRYPQGTVIELGVGLNTRFERVDNGQAHWIEVDLPDAMALRREFFNATPRRVMLADAAESDLWIEEAAARNQPVCIATEGVLVYLDEQAVRSLLARVASRLPGATLAFDSMTPLVIRHQGRHDAMRHFDAQFSWAVTDPAQIESWDQRYRLVESRRFFDMLYAHPRRLPAYMRYLGPLVGAMYPPLRRSYSINLMQLG